MLDVLRLAGTEERLQQRVAQHAVVEGLLEAMQGLLTAGMLEQRGHLGTLATPLRGPIGAQDRPAVVLGVPVS